MEDTMAKKGLSRFEKELLKEYRKQLLEEDRLKKIICTSKEIIMETASKKESATSQDYEKQDDADWNWSMAVRDLSYLTSETLVSFKEYLKTKDKTFALFKKDEISRVRLFPYLTNYKYRGNLRLSREYHYLSDISGIDIIEANENKKFQEMFEKYGCAIIHNSSATTRFAGKFKNSILSGLENGMKTEETIKILRKTHIKTE